MVLTLRSPPDCLCAVNNSRASSSRNFTLIWTQANRNQQSLWEATSKVHALAASAHKCLYVMFAAHTAGGTIVDRSSSELCSMENGCCLAQQLH